MESSNVEGYNLMPTTYSLMIQSIVYLICGIVGLIGLQDSRLTGIEQTSINILGFTVIILSISMMLLFRENWKRVTKYLALKTPFIGDYILNKVMKSLPDNTYVEMKYKKEVIEYLYLSNYILGIKELNYLITTYIGKANIILRISKDSEGDTKLIAKIKCRKFNYEKFLKLTTNWRLSDNYYRYKALVIRV